MAQSPPSQRPERLRSRGDFSAVMRNGRRARHRVLHVVALHTGAPSTRVGLSVGRQVGGAVVRNRLKRRLRMIVHGLTWRPGFDVVVLARPGAESETFEEISSILETSAEKIRLLESARHPEQR